MTADVDISNVILQTPRLRLRPWRESDLADFYAYASVEGVGEMAGWAHHSSPDISRTILEMFIREKKTFAIELKESGAVIGSIGLEVPEYLDDSFSHLRGREVGYVLSRDHWGRGLMSEGVRAVVDYCFRLPQFDFLTCSHFDHNHRSRRVIEKTGFHFVKDVEYRTQLGTVLHSKLYVQFNPNK